MARKIDKKVAAGEQVDNDLEILHPERSLVVGGKSITVREYGFVEGLRLHKPLAPFMDAIYRLVENAIRPPLAQIILVIAEHLDCVLPAIADATDVDMDFINSLSEAEGYDLIYVWWAVNGPFFWRRAHARINSEALEKSLSAGQTFTPPLSPSGTPQTESAATPSDK